MQDELKRLTELVPTDKNFEEELLKIRAEIFGEIRHTIRSLSAAQKAEGAYEGEKEFVSFLWKDIFPKTKMLNVQIEKFLTDPKVRENLSLMASAEYIPPAQFRDAMIHLIELYAFYAKLYAEKQPFSLAEIVLIYSFSKLMFMAGNFYEYYLHKGNRELKRTKRSSKAQKSKAQKKRDYIVHIFPHVKKKVVGVKANLSTIAEAVKEDWQKFPPPDKDIIRPPGITFIKETLLNDEKTKREFEKVGGLWIVKM
jgi:hypothetical protein